MPADAESEAAMCDAATVAGEADEIAEDILALENGEEEIPECESFPEAAEG